jgi:hypothetical protein
MSIMCLENAVCKPWPNNILMYKRLVYGLFLHYSTAKVARVNLSHSEAFSRVPLVHLHFPGSETSRSLKLMYDRGTPTAMGPMQETHGHGAPPREGSSVCEHLALSAEK